MPLHHNHTAPATPFSAQAGIAVLLALLAGGCASTADVRDSERPYLPQIRRGAAPVLVEPASIRSAASTADDVSAQPSPSMPLSSAPSYSASAIAAAVPGVMLDPRAEDAPTASKTGAAKKPGAQSASDLAKKIQNPVANLISVPFENNWNFNSGTYRRTQFVMSAKPVVPQKLDDDWLWIHRAIVPLIDQPSLAPGASSRFGLGDVTYQGFLTPAKPDGLIWGVGPAITFPTATDDVLGSDKWSAGPALLGLKSEGPWVYGALVTNQWQIASQDSDRQRVGIGSIQPFVNYNFERGWYLTTSPVITANWKADRAGDVWTVPVGVGVGKVFKIGDQPVNVSLRPYYNVHHADDASNWSLFFQVTLMFPE